MNTRLFAAIPNCHNNNRHKKSPCFSEGDQFFYKALFVATSLVSSGQRTPGFSRIGLVVS